MRHAIGKFSSSLRVRLMVLVLLAMLPALGLLLYTASEQRQMAGDDAVDRALRFAHVVSAQHQQLFEGAHQLLVALAQLPEVRAHEGDCNALFGRLLSQYGVYANLGVIGLDGRVLCSALPVGKGLDLSDRGYFQRAKSTRDFSVGEYQIGRITHRASVNVAYPVLDDHGAVESVVFAAIDLNWLNGLASRATPPFGSVVTVLDEHGRVLARTDDPERWVGHLLPPPVLETMRLVGGDGVGSADVNGESTIYAFSPLAHSPAGDVYVAVSVSEHAAYAPADALLRRNMAALAAVTLLALALTWIVGEALISQRVRRLVTAVHRVGSGDLTARADPGRSGDDEIGLLARAFDGMAESLEQREEALRATNADLAAAYDATIEGWARALDLRDSDTTGHTRRVTDMTVRLVRRMGLPEDEIVHVRRGAILHDIGKMGIPDAILLKPGRLTAQEWAVMHQHPEWARDLLKHIDFLERALDIPYYHHERWDGSGYPMGLKGEDIPLAARIFAVVDVWDAITTDRPYRAAWTQERARDYLRENAGVLFDHRVVDCFLELVDEIQQDSAVTADARAAAPPPEPAFALRGWDRDQA